MTLLNALIREGLETSNNTPLGNDPKIYSPVRFLGDGGISFGKNVHLGTIKGPGAYSMSQMIAANQGEIIIGDNVTINNNFYIFAYGARITISNHTIIGSNLQIMTFNGHRVDPSNRGAYDSSKPISIGVNCWLGNNVRLFKGSIIGNNSVINAGCVISSKTLIPDNSIVSLNPSTLQIQDIEFKN